MIERHVDRIPLGLKELHFHASKNSHQSDIQLCVGETHAQTAPAAFAKADEIRRERLVCAGSFGVTEPAVGVEGLAGWKYTLIVVLKTATQADGDAGRDGIGAVLGRRVKYARESLGDPVGESEC